MSEVYRSVEGVSVIPRAKLYVQWKRNEVIKVCVWICCFLINMGRVQLSSCGLLAPCDDVCLLLSGFDLVFCLTGTVSRFPFLQGWLEYEGPQHEVQSTHRWKAEGNCKSGKVRAERFKPIESSLSVCFHALALLCLIQSSVVPAFKFLTPWLPFHGFIFTPGNTVQRKPLRDVVSV